MKLVCATPPRRVATDAAALEVKWAGGGQTIKAAAAKYGVPEEALRAHVEGGWVARTEERILSNQDMFPLPRRWFGMTVQTNEDETQQAALVHRVAVDVEREAVQKIAALTSHEMPFVAMPDLDLVKATYDLVGTIKSDELSDRFYWLINEILERFAPAAEWAHIEQQYKYDDNRENELAACKESIERREAARELFRGAQVKGGEESA